MSGSGSAPASRSKSGRTTRTKVTNTATGFPGSPTKAAPSPLFDARQNAHRHRTTRLDRDPPEDEPTDAFDRVAHVIGFAGRDAARSQHQIVSGGGGREPARELFRIVGENAEIGDLDAVTREQSGEQIAIGIVERRPRQSRSGLGNFIAGREYRHPDAAAHIKLGETERRRECDVLHAKPPARGQCEHPGFHIFTGEPAIGAVLQAGRHQHVVAIDATILLHEDSIGAFRHRRAGEDANGLARFYSAAGCMARGDAIDDGQARVCIRRQTVGANGVTIDGRIIEWRNIDGRNDVTGEHAALRLTEVNTLPPVDRDDPFGNETLGVINRKQRTVEGEAIVGELRHQAGFLAASSVPTRSSGKASA